MDNPTRRLRFGTEALMRLDTAKQYRAIRREIRDLVRLNRGLVLKSAKSGLKQALPLNNWHLGLLLACGLVLGGSLLAVLVRVGCLGLVYLGK